MDMAKKSIATNLRVATAYDQWTQFEDFPQFMDDLDRFREYIESVNGERN